MVYVFSTGTSSVPWNVPSAIQFCEQISTLFKECYDYVLGTFLEPPITARCIQSHNPRIPFQFRNTQSQTINDSPSIRSQNSCSQGQGRRGLASKTGSQWRAKKDASQTATSGTKGLVGNPQVSTLD